MDRIKVKDTTREVIILKNRMDRYQMVSAEIKYRSVNCSKTVLLPPHQSLPHCGFTIQYSTILMEFMTIAMIKKHFRVFHLGFKEIRPVKLIIKRGSKSLISKT